VPERGQDLADAIDLAAVSPCFDRESLANEIERWLERRVVDSRLRIKVTRTRDALSFAIAVGNKPAQYRDFEEVPRDCAGERRMLALSIALAIDAVSPKVGRQGSSRFALLLDGMVGTSTADRPSLGAGLDARVRTVPAIWPGIGFFVVVAKDQPVNADLSARFDNVIVAARLEVCGVLPASRTIDIGGCAEAFLGSSTVVAKGVDEASAEGQFWSAAAVTLELHVRFTPAFGVHVGVDGSLALRPGRVEVLDRAGQPAAETDLPRLGATLRLGPSAYF